MLIGAIYFHSCFSPHMEVNGAHINCSVIHILLNIFRRRMKFIQIWNNFGVSKRWQNFHLWVNYPFNVFSDFLIPLKNTLGVTISLLLSTQPWFLWLSVFSSEVVIIHRKHWTHAHPWGKVKQAMTALELLALSQLCFFFVCVREKLSAFIFPTVICLLSVPGNECVLSFPKNIPPHALWRPVLYTSPGWCLLQ